MKKTGTVRVNGNMIFKGHKLTIGLDLGDRWSNYCVLDEAGEILLEQKLATTPEAMQALTAQASLPLRSGIVCSLPAASFPHI
jgi:transposase